jgi:serine/threonine-protein kinase HipA
MVVGVIARLAGDRQLFEYLAKRADVNSEREFFLLAVLGADLPDALVVAPLEREAQAPEAHDDDVRHEESHGGEEPWLESAGNASNPNPFTFTLRVL